MTTSTGSGTKNAALFSIIVTTHSRPQLLERAMLSLLAQSFTDFEIVLVTDEASAATKAMACRYLREDDIFLVLPNTRGPSETRNAGVYHAKGRFVLFLDDDDTFHPTFLQALVEHTSFRADAVNYVNYTKLTEARGTTSIQTTSTENIAVGGIGIRNLLVANFIPNNAFVYGAAMAKSNLFDQHLSSHEDWDYLIALLFKYEFNFIDMYGPIVHVSEGESRNNDAKNSGTIVLDYLSIYRKWAYPDEEVKLARQATLQSHGMNLPHELL